MPDGVEIFCRDYAPDRRGIPILCLHGLTRNSADFEDLADHLATHYRVLAPDVRGRGQSQWDPEWTNYHVGTYSNDIIALLAHLGVKKAMVIGTSMGGLIAMTVQATMPGLWSAVVLNDIGPEIAQAGLDRLKGYVGVKADIRNWDDAAAYVRRLNEGQLPGLSDADWGRIARRMLHEGAEGRPVPAYDPALARLMAQPQGSPVPDLWPLFDGLRNLPLLLLRGSFSDLLTPETARKMAERHSNITLVEIPNRGHAPLLDEPPALQAIDHFARANAGGEGLASAISSD